MKIFSCSTCGQVVFFENVRCIHCGAALAYLPDQANMGAMVEGDGVLSSTLPGARGVSYRLCQNSIDHGVCNWAVPVADDSPLCRACRLNSIIPDLSHPGALTAWGRIEQAKRRLLYTLMQLELPIDSQREKKGGLVFSFLESDAQAPSPVLTGHDDGHITLNIAEADNPGRERLREQLGETYRTLARSLPSRDRALLLGRSRPRHARAGRPSATSSAIPARTTTRSSKRHYQQGPPPDWQSAFVSTYATMHPWEDWAETWAHYLHIVDTLGTARSVRNGAAPASPWACGETPRDLHFTAKRLDVDDFEDLIDGGFPSPSRSTASIAAWGSRISTRSCCPIAPIQKLRFVHDVIERARVAT